MQNMWRQTAIFITVTKIRLLSRKLYLITQNKILNRLEHVIAGEKNLKTHIKINNNKVEHATERYYEKDSCCYEEKRA